MLLLHFRGFHVRSWTPDRKRNLWGKEDEQCLVFIIAMFWEFYHLGSEWVCRWDVVNTIIFWRALYKVPNKWQILCSQSQASNVKPISVTQCYKLFLSWADLTTTKLHRFFFFHTRVPQTLALKFFYSTKPSIEYLKPEISQHAVWFREKKRGEQHFKFKFARWCIAPSKTCFWKWTN